MMTTFRLVIASVVLALFLGACGSGEPDAPEAPEADAPAPQEAAQTEEVSAGPPYPPLEEAEPEDPTLLVDEEPLTISPEDMEAESLMEEELAKTRAILGDDEDLWPSDEELVAEMRSGEKLPAATDEPEPTAMAEDSGGTDPEPPPGVDEESGMGTYPQDGAANKLLLLGSLELVYFDYDAHELSPAAMEALDRDIEWLANNPDARVRVEGHCDERGTSEYNLALGQRRANRVVEYLVSQGIDGGRLMAVSFGEEIPLSFGHEPADWARNRRVEFSMLEDESSDFGREAPRHRMG